MSTIYLSSTYDDLKDHRAAVAQVLRRAGHTVIGMEDYAAYDERPRDKCVADVVRSDLYVGLFAWRYGFVPKDNNLSGRPSHSSSTKRPLTESGSFSC
jgi:Domain of unknown function (DUF4062)